MLIDNRFPLINASLRSSLSSPSEIPSIYFEVGARVGRKKDERQRNGGGRRWPLKTPPLISVKTFKRDFILVLSFM